MSDDLRWSGAWRRLGPGDGMGMVTGVKVGLGSAIAPDPAGTSKRPASKGTEAMRVEATQLREPTDDTVTTVGRVRLTRS